MDPIKQFESERIERIDKQGKSENLKIRANDFFLESVKTGYSYNFSWMGRPIIQYPQDMIAMQELIWEIKPDLLIETGIAHGGSLLYYASLLELIGRGEVLGVDIDIRSHNKSAIEGHPMFKRVKMIEGSSIDENVVQQVKEIAVEKRTVMVVLDSNHTHDHVQEELKLYSPFVTLNSYIVVFDTVIQNMPADYDWGERSWSKGNNPMTAVESFLRTNDNFQIDKRVDNKLLISVAPSGYLRKVK